jgi:hypothetical protein
MYTEEKRRIDVDTRLKPVQGLNGGIVSSSMGIRKLT